MNMNDILRCILLWLIVVLGIFISIARRHCSEIEIKASGIIPPAFLTSNAILPVYTMSVMATTLPIPLSPICHINGVCERKEYQQTMASARHPLPKVEATYSSLWLIYLPYH